MKPAFALSFSENGISLHHQADGDWYCIGTVPLDAADLNDRIQALRERGFALATDLSCSLIIPADQVKLLTVDTDGLSQEETDQKVRDTLATATPYALADLAYAVIPEEHSAQVAAVARQTLDEAKAFASSHGFIPETAYVCASGGDALTEAMIEIPLPIAVDAEIDPAAIDTTTSPSEDSEDLPSIPIHQIAESTEPAPFQPQDVTQHAKLFENWDAKRLAVPIGVGSLIFGVVLGMWSLIGTEPEIETPDQVAEQISAPATQPAPVEGDERSAETDAQVATDTPAPDDIETPAVSATDAAILEALSVAPEPVDQIASAPATEETNVLTFTGTIPSAPTEPEQPSPEILGDIYLASLDRSDLSQDAIALPPLDSYATDLPFEQVALPSQAGQRFVLDENGLVVPTPDGALNPDGVVVYLGRPASVPPEPPVRFEAEPELEEPDNRLAQIRPRPRPEDLVDQFERQQLGGRSLSELASVRPKLRPDNLKVTPTVDHTPTALAVVRVPRPKLRPARVAALADQKTSTGTAPLGSTANVSNSRDEAGSFQARSVKPKIPTTASVARQATIDNAINLRQLNLIGVYGTPANRRALVRLPSGRYKKLKVGDRIDGGNVVAIGDSELRYQKRGRNVTLKMPRG